MKNLILTVAILPFLFSCSPTDVEETLTIRYTISCQDCDVTYFDSLGNSTKVKNQDHTWSYAWEAQRNQIISVAAKNNLDWGTVEASIYIDDVLYKHSTARGDNVVAFSHGHAH